MTINIIIYFIFSVFFNVYISQASIVNLEVPPIINKNTAYKLLINNPKPDQQFPVEDFAFSFELLLSLSPRKVLSVGDVTNTLFTNEEYRGFSLSEAVFNKDSIIMNIHFRNEAHGTFFRIRYTSAKTDSEKEKFFNGDVDSFVIFEKYIEMYLPHTLTILSSPEIREVRDATDREAIGHSLLPDKYGQISCQATEGLPNAFPVFVNKNILSTAAVTMVNNDTIKLIWIVRLEDHGKVIKCAAGQDVQNLTINVYHYMTAVSVSPPIINKKLSRGSQIKCIGKNGYPVAKTRWTFLVGPNDARKYFEYRDENVTLLINDTAPLNSTWIFECQGYSYMNPVVANYLKKQPPLYPIKQTYSFTIVDADALQSSTALITVLILLLLAVLAIAVVGFFKKEKIHMFIQEKMTRSSQPIKVAAQKQDFGYGYREVCKGDPRVNGAEKEDATYLEIVGTVQPKGGKSLGPIHRV